MLDWVFMLLDDLFDSLMGADVLLSSELYISLFITVILPTIAVGMLWRAMAKGRVS